MQQYDDAIVSAAQLLATVGCRHFFLVCIRYTFCAFPTSELTGTDSLHEDGGGDDDDDDGGDNDRNET